MEVPDPAQVLVLVQGDNDQLETVESPALSKESAPAQITSTNGLITDSFSSSSCSSSTYDSKISSASSIGRTKNAIVNEFTNFATSFNTNLGPQEPENTDSDKSDSDCDYLPPQKKSHETNSYCKIEFKETAAVANRLNVSSESCAKLLSAAFRDRGE